MTFIDQQHTVEEECKYMLTRHRERNGPHQQKYIF